MNGLLVTLQLWHFDIFSVLPLLMFLTLELGSRCGGLQIFPEQQEIWFLPHPLKDGQEKGCKRGKDGQEKGCNWGPKKGCNQGTRKRAPPGPENMVQPGPQKWCNDVPPKITNGANAVPPEDRSSSEVKFANFGLPLLSVVIFGVFVVKEFKYTYTNLNPKYK